MNSLNNQHKPFNPYGFKKKLLLLLIEIPH